MIQIPLLLSHSLSFYFCSSAYRNAAEIVQYGVKNNTTFLECAPKSPQASIKWLLQKDKDRRKEVSNAGEQQSIRASERALNHHPSARHRSNKKGRTYEHPLVSLGWQVPSSLKSFVHEADGLIRNPICLLTSITQWLKQELAHSDGGTDGRKHL